MANFIIKAGKYNFKGTLVNIPNDIHPTINSKNDEDNIKDLLQSLETMINHIGKKGTDKDYIKINNIYYNSFSDEIQYLDDEIFNKIMDIWQLIIKNIFSERNE